MSKKILSYIMGLLMILTALTACKPTETTKESTSGSTAAPAETTAGGQAETSKETKTSNLPPLKIGMITQFTGVNSFGGYEYQYGAEMALEHIGGEINGRKIEMVFADGPTPDATLSEFERLYNDGIRVFISGYGCIADRTFATMVDEMKAMYLSLAWDADLIQGESDYFFRGGANVNDFAGGAMEQAIGIGKQYLGKEAKDLKVALLYTTGLSHVAAPMIAKGEENKVQIVINEAYPAEIKDFVPIITKLQNTEFDILMPLQRTTDGSAFLKKIQELNYRPKVILAGGIFYDTPNFADLGNEITDGILTQSYTTPSIAETAAPGITKFTKEFEARHGHKPLAHALQAYGGMHVYFECLKKMDPADWDDTGKIGETMKTLDIPEGQLPWYWGVKFDELNNNTLAGQMIVNMWEGGQLSPVFPDFLATKKAVIPYKK